MLWSSVKSKSVKKLNNPNIIFTNKTKISVYNSQLQGRLYSYYNITIAYKKLLAPLVLNNKPSGYRPVLKLIAKWKYASSEFFTGIVHFFALQKNYWKPTIVIISLLSFLLIKQRYSILWMIRSSLCHITNCSTSIDRWYQV